MSPPPWWGVEGEGYGRGTWNGVSQSGAHLVPIELKCWECKGSDGQTAMESSEHGERCVPCKRMKVWVHVHKQSLLYLWLLPPHPQWSMSRLAHGCVTIKVTVQQPWSKSHFVIIQWIIDRKIGPLSVIGLFVLRYSSQSQQTRILGPNWETAIMTPNVVQHSSWHDPTEAVWQPCWSVSQS